MRRRLLREYGTWSVDEARPTPGKGKRKDEAQSYDFESPTLIGGQEGVSRHGSKFQRAGFRSASSSSFSSFPSHSSFSSSSSSSPASSSYGGYGRRYGLGASRPRYTYTRYRPYRSSGSLLGTLWNTKIFRQAVICLAAYGLILAAIQGPSPISVPAARLLGRVVSEEYDFVAVMKRIPGADYIKEKTLIPLPFLFKEEVKNPDPLKPGAMIWPLEGSITSSFGWRKNTSTGTDEFHQGLDIEAPLGTPILAVMDGHVSSVNESVTYGRVVVLDHGDGLETVYAHCSEVLVKPPQLIKQGEVIARVGITGNARTPHLHFEVRRDGTPVDPRTFLVPSGGGDMKAEPSKDTSAQGTSSVVPESNVRVSKKLRIHGDAL